MNLNIHMRRAIANRVVQDLPTVDVYQNNKLWSHSELCGPCYFGEADCIDPENW